MGSPREENPFNGIERRDSVNNAFFKAIREV